MTMETAVRSEVAELGLVKSRMGEILQRVNRYWAGEVEVAATYFSRPRAAEEHLRWLKSQMVRELGWPDGRLGRIAEAYKQVEREVDRHEVLSIFEAAEEEYSHYVLFADIAEAAAGRRIVPEEILYNKELPEWKGLERVRTRATDWDTAVSSLHEGGGLGIYYAAMQLPPMDGDPYREAIAVAMRTIYDDEIEHAAHGFRAVLRLATTATDALWQQIVEKAEAVGYHRVRMRNEQFGFPLSEARLEEIRQGKIAPYLPPLPDIAEVYEQVAPAARARGG